MASIKAAHGRVIIRMMGIINVLFALLGMYAASATARIVVRTLHNTVKLPYVREAYYVSTVIDLCCLFLLAAGGIYLLGLSRLGLRISNIVFVSEITWFLVGGVIEVFLSMSSGRWGLVGESMAAAGGIGAVGTAPQIITAYPVWALVLLNLSRAGFPDRPPK